MPKADPAPAAPVAVAADGQPTAAVLTTPATVVPGVTVVPTVSLADSLPALSEDKDWLSVGYYGLEGSGKTADLLAMARLGRMLLVNAESGAKPSALRRLGIPYENIRPWPDAEKGETVTFESFEALYFRVKTDLLADPTSWIGVGFDSLTEVVRLLIADERQRQYHRAIRRGKERERYFTDRDDYQAVTAMIGEKLREYRHLPCHFGFTALERRDDDGMYGPAANPAIANDLPGFVDLLVHTERQEVGDDGPDVFAGWMSKHGKYRAKDRYGWFPKILPDPQFDRLLGWVREDITPENDERLAEVKARRAKLAGEVVAVAT